MLTVPAAAIGVASGLFSNTEPVIVDVTPGPERIIVPPSPVKWLWDTVNEPEVTDVGLPVFWIKTLSSCITPCPLTTVPGQGGPTQISLRGEFGCVRVRFLRYRKVAGTATMNMLSR